MIKILKEAQSIIIKENKEYLQLPICGIVLQHPIT
jgi:hypothetical protein